MTLGSNSKCTQKRACSLDSHATISWFFREGKWVTRRWGCPDVSGFLGSMDTVGGSDAGKQIAISFDSSSMEGKSGASNFAVHKIPALGVSNAGIL